MSDRSTEPGPSDDGPAKREEFRKAVHDLYLASLEGSRRGLVEAALALVRSDVDRLVRLHAVASTTNRRPDLVLGTDQDDPASAFAEAVLAGPDRDDPRTVDDVALGLRRFAETAQTEPAGLTPPRWRTFLVTTREPGYVPDDRGGGPLGKVGRSLSAAAARVEEPELPLARKPGCNDDEVLATASGAASTIRSRFTVNRDLADAARFIDPLRWVECGRPFWEHMDPVDGTVKPDPRNPRCYTAVFREIVRLPFGAVTAHLLIRYEETPDYVFADYRLAGRPHPNTDVTFDSGWLHATRADDASGPGTFVEGLKAVRFSNEKWNTFPDLACDGGWVYFMINMALGGKGLPPGGEVETRTVPFPGPARDGDVADVLGALGGVIDGWSAEMAGTLRGYGAATKSAVRKGLGPDCDPGWVNDVVGMGHGAVEATNATLTAWREALAALGKLGGGR